MLKDETRKTLNEMGRSVFGQALKEYLEEEKLKINNVREVDSLEDAKGRALALDTIDRLFGFLNEHAESGGRTRYN